MGVLGCAAQAVTPVPKRQGCGEWAAGGPAFRYPQSALSVVVAG
jgi:hypothetical protein